uniref:Uncharacterized protein n=1 Tax=Oryza brachyantha TaxID=4533 RepID=J3MA36_ORYBR
METKRRWGSECGGRNGTNLELPLDEAISSASLSPPASASPNSSSYGTAKSPKSKRPKISP